MKVGLTPEVALARWPGDWPLVVLWSGEGDPEARWVVLGRPRGIRAKCGFLSGAALAGEPGGSGALGRLAGSLRCSALTDGPARPAGLALPLNVVALDYELGGVIEPAAGMRGAARARTSVTLVQDGLVFDRHTGQCWEFGDVRASELLEEPSEEAFRVGTLASDVGRDGYQAGVQRALEYIRAGDVYQVNLAHRLRGSFEGSTRGLMRALLASARPRYGAYIEDDERTIVSMSPESFIEIDGPTRRVVTRPMKGTRPAGADPGKLAERELRASQKDRAELAMIVDLMRNDLGRVCVPGSMRVDAARRIEAHAAHDAGGVLQATAQVSGTLREGCSVGDVLLATFPGGSVTGAPKIRAMQIIEEIEGVPRGIYCGAIGYVAADGSAAFNIAIRTATIEGGVLTYPVGAGIVADSDPAAEWEETLVKAGVVGRVAKVENR